MCRMLMLWKPRLENTIMIRFNSLDNSNREYWENIYYEAFPEAERIPFNDIFDNLRLLSEVKISVIVEDNQPVGIILLVELDKKSFILYLAVDSSLRGGGIGRKVLETLDNKYTEGFILESEETSVNATNQEQRQARYNFYKRNGLIDTHIISHNMGGDFHLLKSKESITEVDYVQALNILNIEATISPHNF